MHSVTTEVRVGIFALITLSILAFSLFWLSGGRFFDQGYMLEIIFDRVDGIRPGAPVKLAGVDVGRVKRIYFAEDQNVVVAVKLQPKIQIREGARFVITSAGVIGEKHLEILPGKSEKPVQEGVRLQGETPISTEDFFRSAYDLLKDTQRILSSIQKFTDDEELQASIRSSVDNIQVLTLNLRRFSDRLDAIPLETMIGRINRTLETLERITTNSEPQVRQIVADLAKASNQITAVLVKANNFLDEVNGDGQASQDIRRILNLSVKTLEDIEQLTSTLNQEKEHIGPILEEAEGAARSVREAADSIKNILDGVSSQDSTNTRDKDLTSTLQQAAAMVNKAHNVVSALERIDHRVGVSGSDSTAGLTYRFDFGINDHSSLVFDWKDIGDQDNLSLQLGYSFGNLRTRLGYINDEFGGGLDYNFNNQWLLSLDIWDPHQTQSDVILSYFMNKHWVVGSGAYDVTEDPIWAWEIGYWF